MEGSGARVIADGVPVALLGEIDPRAAHGLKLKQTVFIAEIYLHALYKAGLRRMQHRRLPRTPSVHRDFSLFVPEGIPFAEVRAAVGHTQHLVQVAPVEVFRGKQVPDGYYSLLLRATWQKDAESLTDEEVNRYAHTISKNLEKKLGVKQRV